MKPHHQEPEGVVVAVCAAKDASMMASLEWKHGKADEVRDADGPVSDSVPISIMAYGEFELAGEPPILRMSCS
jgi:hypothetical protein